MDLDLLEHGFIALEDKGDDYDDDDIDRIVANHLIIILSI